MQSGTPRYKKNYKTEKRSVLFTQAERIYFELAEIYSRLIKAENTIYQKTDFHPSYQISAKNLIHYVEFRRYDLRELQRRLATLGLSSLGRTEKDLLGNLHAMLSLLAQLLGRSHPLISSYSSQIREISSANLGKNKSWLEHHTNDLFGAPPSDRSVRIMVTLPSEAADDFALVQELMKNGMDCARINCAHDDQKCWSQMIVHIQNANKLLKKECKILMDLPGAKIRTGKIEYAPEVLKLKPTRDSLGRVVQPFQIRLTSNENDSIASTMTSFAVPRRWIGKFKCGEKITLLDSRKAFREFIITEVDQNGYIVECSKTVYLTKGLYLKAGKNLCHKITQLPRTEKMITFRIGDEMILRKNLEFAIPPQRDHKGKLLKSAQIGCNFGRVFKNFRIGDKVWFDDGKIGGEIIARKSDRCKIRITQAQATGDRLRSEKGINFPDTPFDLEPLESDDFKNLHFIAEHADIVGISFMRTEKDFSDVLNKIQSMKTGDLGVILKIETKEAFQNLPRLLLSGMRLDKLGVMIARGDLAIECGYERLAEVQEEILWICEAAHVPVIWATQVLENLAKKGLPTRAEVTDAAMAQRAECVMLNKGDYIVPAVKTLRQILHRMVHHQDKKVSLLRGLSIGSAWNLSKKRNSG